MRRSLLVAIVAVVVALAACGPASPHGGPSHGGPDASPSDPSCSGSETRCLADQYQECMDGTFHTTQTCAKSCSPTLGCVDCDPAGGNTCNGNDVVSCTNDGHYGGVVQSCTNGDACAGGTCSSVCSADGVDLIYVVDEQNELLSFDPRKIAGGASQAFHKIGTLNCQAGPNVPGYTPPLGTTGASPFSMGVDRNAVAWVLYTSGEIFEVSTANASCTKNSGYTKEQNGMELFGMGFVTDAKGGNTEHLYLGGGNIDAQMTGGKLANLDPTSPGKATPTGNLPMDGEYSPELTGTGDAELFGFFPGINTAFVEQLDKTTGKAVGTKWDIPNGLGGGAGDQVVAWAFAQWGGYFYIFVTTSDSLGISTNSTVRRINRQTKAYETVLSKLPYNIVGAGVSTCAPVVVN